MKSQNNGTYAVILIFALFLSGLFGSIFAENVYAASGPVTVSLSANPGNVNKGEKTNLSWNSINADFCVAYSGWYGVRAVSGNETVVPREATTFRISCSNTSGFSGSAQVTVTVGELSNSLISVNVTANPESIFRGESTTLIWSSTNATSCEASGGWSGIKRPYGSEVVSPSVTYSYTLQCNNDLGEFASDTQTIFVNPSSPPYPTPSTGQFNAACVPSESRVAIGQTITFAGAQSQGAEPVSYRWSGDVSGNTQTVKTSFNAAGTKTVQLTVTDANGKTASATCSVQVISSGITPVEPIIKTTKISSPANLNPNDKEFSSDTKEVTLTWDSVKGAKSYAIRAEPESKTDSRDERNNCPGNPHYLCINNLDSTSIKIQVKPGNTYSWWVHAADASGTFSDPAFARFSVKSEEAKTGGNLFAVIFGGLLDLGIFLWGLMILIFIIGYLIGKKRGRKKLNL